jgi:hypothetical protein
VCRTALVVTVQEHFIAYCRCRDAVELLRLLLSPYSLVGTGNSVQNCIFLNVREHFVYRCASTMPPHASPVHGDVL